MNFENIKLKISIFPNFKLLPVKVKNIEVTGENYNRCLEIIIITKLIKIITKLLLIIL